MGFEPVLFIRPASIWRTFPAGPGVAASSYSIRPANAYVRRRRKPYPPVSSRTRSTMMMISSVFTLRVFGWVGLHAPAY
jgi:hypothetical protein